MHVVAATRRTNYRIGVALVLVLALGLGGVLLSSGLAVAHGPVHVDTAHGFKAVPFAPPAEFTDGVRAKFKVKYDRGRTIVANVPRDASNVLFAEVSWEPKGSSGWHTHPGPAIVTVAEGAVAVTNAGDCVTRTYKAGEAFLDPGQGNVHIARNPSDTASAKAYAVFLDVPDGGPATKWVEPVTC